MDPLKTQMDADSGASQRTHVDADKRDSQTGAILGAAIEVHRLLGAGFLEAVYQEPLALEFGRQSIPLEREVALPISYKGQRLACAYRVDFICWGTVIVELKALAELTTLETAQGLNYLKASGLERALLLNFGTTRLTFKRLVRSTAMHTSATSAFSASSADFPSSAE